MMSNGEKTLPSPLENALLAHPLIRSAVVFGCGRNHVGILIEVENTKSVYSHNEQSELRGLFWYAAVLVERRL
jgi:long-subunit acyl-CoA synthetase (AMP-forming)